MSKSMKFYGMLALCLSILSGCATLDGMGQDIESAGEAVQDAADS